MCAGPIMSHSLLGRPMNPKPPTSGLRSKPEIEKVDVASFKSQLYTSLKFHQNRTKGIRIMSSWHTKWTPCNLWWVSLIISILDSDGDVEAALKEIDEEEKGILADQIDGNSKDSRSSSENQLLSKPIKEPKEFSSSSDSGREDEQTKPKGNRL